MNGEVCGILPFGISNCHNKSRRTDPDTLRKRIKAIRETHVRCRRVYYILCREGRAVNAKKVYRLYSELGPQLRDRTPKHRVRRSCWRIAQRHSNASAVARAIGVISVKTVRRAEMEVIAATWPENLIF